MILDILRFNTTVNLIISNLVIILKIKYRTMRYAVYKVQLFFKE